MLVSDPNPSDRISSFVCRRSVRQCALFGLSAVIAATLFTLSGPVRAANLVQDGDFESAAPGASQSFTPFSLGETIDGGNWFVTGGAVGIDTNDSYIFDGSQSLLLDGDFQGFGSISQTLTTVPGQAYDISFWANAGSPNVFSLNFDGSQVPGSPTFIFPVAEISGSFDPIFWQQYSATVVASSPTSVLQLSGFGYDPGFQNLDTTMEIDDVSVMPAPEASSLLSFGIMFVLGAILFIRSNKGQRPQL